MVMAFLKVLTEVKGVGMWRRRGKTLQDIIISLVLENMFKLLLNILNILLLFL